MGLLQSNCCLCLRLCLLKAGSGIRCRGGSRQVLPTAHLYSHAVSLNRATHVLKSQARVGGFRLHWKTGNPVGFNWGRHWTLRKLHTGLHRKVEPASIMQTATTILASGYLLKQLLQCRACAVDAGLSEACQHSEASMPAHMPQSDDMHVLQTRLTNVLSLTDIGTRAHTYDRHLRAYMLRCTLHSYAIQHAKHPGRVTNSFRHLKVTRAL